MADKVLIILLVLFTSLGVFTYDKYVTGKGELSPIARILDFSGMAEEEEDFFGQKITVTKETYYSNLKENLNRMRLQHLRLAERREQLIKRRQSILNTLGQINDLVTEEAGTYYEVIDQRRKEIVESQLMGQIEQNLKDSESELDKFTSLTKILDLEYKSQSQSLDEKNKNIREHDQKVEGKFKDLVKELVRISKSDVKEISLMQQELEAEHNNLLSLIERDQFELGSLHLKTDQEAGKIFTNLDKKEDTAFSQYEIYYDDMKEKRNVILRHSATNAGEFKAYVRDFLKDGDFKSAMSQQNGLKVHQQEGHDSMNADEKMRNNKMQLKLLREKARDYKHF